MDICLICKNMFDVDQLCKDSSSKNGYRKRCKQCQRILMKDYKRKHTNKYNHQKRDLIREAKDRPCADCNTKYPYYVMDLDHLPGFTKLFQLGNYVQHTIKEIQHELSKCEAVCANCHRARTHKRSNPD